MFLDFLNFFLATMQFYPEMKINTWYRLVGYPESFTLHQALKAELEGLEQHRLEALPDEVEVDPYATLDERDVEGMDDGELEICFGQVSWPSIYGFESFSGESILTHDVKIPCNFQNSLIRRGPENIQRILLVIPKLSWLLLMRAL